MLRTPIPKMSAVPAEAVDELERLEDPSSPLVSDASIAQECRTARLKRN